MSTAEKNKTESPATSTNQDSWGHTWWYVGAAAIALGITGAIEMFSRPAAIEEYGKIGQQFYPSFVDPTLAKSLEVSVFDQEKVRPVEFRVEQQENGRWVIPSHHDYPSDAEEQLAKTASSIIGITRGAMVTRWEADHIRYGVVNPRQESLNVGDVEGVGERITLRKDDGSVLADFIVGNEVDGEAGQFYVRHPEEDDVYMAKLDINLSTKFSDWIDTDLFAFNNGDILRLRINDYSFNELNGSLTKGDSMELARSKAWGDDWALDSLNKETEELEKTAISDTLSAIADLEVLGVRPKQKGLTPELQLDRQAITSQQSVTRLQQDLLERGFLLQPGDEPESLKLIAREGELFAGTEDGLSYSMYFGRVFTGTEEELEIGFAESSEDKSTGGGDDEKQGETKKEGEENSGTDSEDESPSGQPGRYLFVRVDFDKTLLGEELGAPIEPQKPARLTELEAAEKESASEEKSAKDGEEEGGEKEGEEKEESEIEKLRREFSEAQSTYKEDTRKFDEYQEKVKKGKEKAEELNRRFAEWYYVIPGESYDKLKLKRAGLVKAKEKTEEEGESANNEESPVEDGGAESATIGGPEFPSNEELDAAANNESADPDEAPQADAVTDESQEVDADTGNADDGTTEEGSVDSGDESVESATEAAEETAVESS